MTASLEPRMGGGGIGLPESDAGAGGDGLLEVDAAEAVAQIEGGAAGGEMPALGSLTFPGPVAQAFYFDDRPVVGIQGPVGGGKTTTLVLSRVRRARMIPRSVIDRWRRYKLVVTRETYRQLWSSTIPSYLETIPKALGAWSGGRGAPVQHRVEFEDEFGPIEWIAEFMAFGDDIVASMRGIQTVDLWLSEADTNPQDVLMAGIGRINRWPGQKHFTGYPAEQRSFGQVVCDFNAPDRDNWTYGVFHDQEKRAEIEAKMRQAARARITGEVRLELPELGGAEQREEVERRLERAREFIGFHNQPGGREAAAENLANLAPGYYETQVATMTLAGRGDMIARLVDNRVTYLRAGDPVFKREYSPAIHLGTGRLEPWPDVALRVGLDQGFIGGAVIAQFRAPGHWRVLADMMFPKERLLAREFGERLRDRLDDLFPGMPIEAGWGDMAGEHGSSLAADENMTWNLLVARAAGFVIRPQRIGSNRIQPRLEAVRAALEYLHGGEPGLRVCPVGCRWLPAAFEARYVWTDEINAQGDKRKVPDKSLPEANVMDALQYLLLSEVLADGSSPGSFPQGAAPMRLRPGSAPPPGLRVVHDVLDPYGSAA